MRRWTGFVVRVVLGLMLTSMASAVPAVTITDSNGNSLGGTVTYGWEFTTNAALSVTDLGVFDSQQNGLGESHEVGLFSAAGALLASATVPAGVVAPLINQFRYVAIAPTLLAAGQTFRIGAYYLNANDTVRWPAAGFATDPAITYVGDRATGGPVLADPTFSPGLQPGIFGPNFNFVLAAGAPEMSGHFGAALGFVLLSLCLLEGRRRTSLAS